ncbi:MAG: DUF1178 family protein [Pseudomonadota bacterium]
MIRYTLKCSDGHVFESWFANAEGFDALKAAGHVTCAVCGTAEVEKSLMAPAVSPKQEGPATPAPLDAPASEAEIAMRKLKDHITKHSENVGRAFATTARAIHDGDVPERAIHGEASFEEAKSLVEDGIPVAPLPFIGPRRAN